MTPVKGIQPDELGEVWPTVEPLLSPGIKCAGGRWDMEEVLDSLQQQRRQLWVTWPHVNCALITEILTFPTRKVIKIFWVGGKLPKDWREILMSIEFWGATMGCTEAEAGGRKGWERRMPGYRTAPWITLVKDISHARR